jgi:hypothetical protein
MPSKGQGPTHLHLNAQLFPELAHQGLYGTFPVFYASPRKLPKATQMR